MDLAEHELLVGELELRIDRLRSLYEQYFMGIERLEPSVPRKDVERRVQILRKEQIRNTGLRYRFQMLLQKYNTYQTYWQRICREMEAGTYKRHVIRARARFAREEETALERAKKAGEKPGAVPAPPLSALELEKIGDADDFDLDETPSGSLDVDFGNLDDPFRRPESSMTLLAAQPIRSPPPPAPKTTAPPGTASMPASASRIPLAASQPPGRIWRKATPAAPRHSDAPEPPAEVSRAAPPAVPRPAARPGAPSAPALRTAPLAPAPPPTLSEDRVRQLYSQYVETKRRHNESTAAITYDGLAKSLRESSAKLREKHGKNVDFEVTVKDGKTVIKPVVK